MSIIPMPGHLGPINLEAGKEPVPGVVAVLEKALEQAKAGRIRAVGLAIVGCDSATSIRYGFDKDECISHALVAATAYLHHRYVAHKIGLLAAVAADEA